MTNSPIFFKRIQIQILYIFHSLVHLIIFTYQQQISAQSMNNLNPEQNIPQKRSYSRIPLSKKISLIKSVYRRRLPLDKIIKELNIKKTTAVNIINKYKESGSLPMRKFKKNRKIPKKQVEQQFPETPQSKSIDQVEQNNAEQGFFQAEVDPLMIQQVYQNNWFYFPFSFYSYL